MNYTARLARLERQIPDPRAGQFAEMLQMAEEGGRLPGLAGRTDYRAALGAFRRAVARGEEAAADAAWSALARLLLPALGAAPVAEEEFRELADWYEATGHHHYAGDPKQHRAALAWIAEGPGAPEAGLLVHFLRDLRSGDG
jgi:hypothetical protein